MLNQSTRRNVMCERVAVSFVNMQTEVIV